MNPKKNKDIGKNGFLKPMQYSIFLTPNHQKTAGHRTSTDWLCRPLYPHD